MKDLKEFLDTDLITNVFGKREDPGIAQGYAAGSYRYSKSKYGYLIRKRYSDSNDITVIIYQKGKEDIVKDFKSEKSIIKYLDNFVKVEIRDNKISDILK